MVELTVPQGHLLEVSHTGYETRLVKVPREERFSQSVILDKSAGDTDNEARQPKQAKGIRSTDFCDKNGVAGTPLYLVDGIETDPNDIPTNIYNLTIIPAEIAVDNYGEDRGRFGVVDIRTQNIREMARETEGFPFPGGETMPSFEGGDLGKFRQWLQTQVRYPAKAIEQQIEGRVVCSFVVERDGSVSNITALQSPDRLLTDEVRRVLATSPRWTPGMQKGKTVRVKLVVPVDFKLPPISIVTPIVLDGEDDVIPPIEDIPYLKVDTMPLFRDGNPHAFSQWLQTQIRYPAEALRKRIEGRIICTCVIERDGSVSNVRPLKIADISLYEEVKRALKNSPRWTPGRHKGKIVLVKKVLVVDFPSKRKRPTTPPQQSKETSPFYRPNSPSLKGPGKKRTERTYPTIKRKRAPDLVQRAPSFCRSAPSGAGRGQYAAGKRCGRGADRSGAQHQFCGRPSSRARRCESCVLSITPPRRPAPVP